MNPWPSLRRTLGQRPELPFRALKSPFAERIVPTGSEGDNAASILLFLQEISAGEPFEREETQIWNSHRG